MTRSKKSKIIFQLESNSKSKKFVEIIYPKVGLYIFFNAGRRDGLNFEPKTSNMIRILVPNYYLTTIILFSMSDKNGIFLTLNQV